MCINLFTKMLLVSTVLSGLGLFGMDYAFPSPPRNNRVAFLPDQEQFMSPPRPTVGQVAIKPSPGTDLTYLTNFHKKMIRALRTENFTGFSDLLNNYLTLIPYDLVIKDERFFLSLFYLIFSLISNESPCFSPHDRLVTSMIKTKSGKVYALEFSFADREHSRAYLVADNNEILPVIRIICDVEDAYAIKVVGVKKTQARHCIFFDTEDVSDLSYEQNNFARNILSVLAEDDFDTEYFQNNLYQLYNAIPPCLIIEKEKYFQAIFVLILTFVRAGASRHEIISSIGRSDVMISSDAVINVIEFKHRGSVKKALQQIKDKGYCAIYHLQQKNIRMVGINVACDHEKGDVCVSVGAQDYDLPAHASFVWTGDDGAEVRVDPLAKQLFMGE